MYLRHVHREVALYLAERGGRGAGAGRGGKRERKRERERDQKDLSAAEDTELILNFARDAGGRLGRQRESFDP